MKLHGSDGQDNRHSQPGPEVSFVLCGHFGGRTVIARASRHSASVRRRQVNMGVSRSVKQLALASRAPEPDPKKVRRVVSLEGDHELLIVEPKE